MDAVIRWAIAESNMQDRARTTEPAVLSGETTSFASPYIGINSGYFCCFSQGSIAKISNSCRHMPVAATGGLHLQFRLFALLAYFFRHTRSLTNRPSSRGGHFKSHCYESLLAMPRAREHAVCRAPSRARQWNALVNVKEKQLLHSMRCEIGYNRHHYVVFGYAQDAVLYRWRQLLSSGCGPEL